ncbi:hypothetical protein CN354_15140 [Bacillus cereus]|nr:hypothetical protein CN354_15140 [Bacillus cereus]
MKLIFVLLNVCVNSILAILLPYTTIFIFTCIYYIGTIIGYFDGLDIVGEEDVIIVLIPITLILIMILILVGIFGNKYICKRMDIGKLNYFLFSGLIFLLVFSLVMFTLDPFHII